MKSLLCVGFEEVRVPPVEVLKDIWAQSIHILKGQYEVIQGSVDIIALKHHHFLYYWKHFPLLILKDSSPLCCYKLPLWLFPPPIT